MSKNEPKYYLTLIEKKIYRMLLFMLGPVVEQKGEALIGSTTAFISNIFHINKIMEYEGKVKRLLGKI